MSSEQLIHTISFGQHREKGPVRQENQDQIAYFQSSVFGHVFVIADGMGGHEGGAIAANMAITGFKQHFQSVSLRLPLRESIVEAARLTNLDIFEKSNNNGEGANPLRMGSTLVLCVVAGNFCTVANAGDSRCYSFRNGELRRLTKDHTAVQKMVESGMISAEEARTHPDASVLTRAFGQRPEIEIDVYDPFMLAPDEKLLLCSDGLYGYVEESAIVDRLQRYSDPQAVADALLQLALEAGGQDNISIFVIRVDPPSQRPGTAPDPPLEAEAQSGAAPAAVASRNGGEPARAADSSSKSAESTPHRRKTGRRVAITLLVLAVVLAAALFVLRPDLIPGAVRDWLTTVQPPAALRDRLASWGIVSRDHPIAPQKTAPDAAVAEVNTPGADKPAATSSLPETAGGKAAGAPLPAASRAVQLSTQPPAAASPPNVFIAFPPDTSSSFRNGIAGFQNQLQAAGYKPVLSEKPVQAKGVWRAITASPATFAPSQVHVSVVFLPGYQKDAARICAIVSCSEPEPRPLVPADRKLFENAFPGGPIVLFVHPKAVKQDPAPVAVPPEGPAAPQE